MMMENLLFTLSSLGTVVFGNVALLIVMVVLTKRWERDRELMKQFEPVPVGTAASADEPLEVETEPATGDAPMGDFDSDEHLHLPLALEPSVPATAPTGGERLATELEPSPRGAGTEELDLAPPTPSVLAAPQASAPELEPTPAHNTATEESPLQRALTKRLSELSITRDVERATPISRPLPMPTPPAGVEPVPELEPTEVMHERPDWMREERR